LDAASRPKDKSASGASRLADVRILALFGVIIIIIIIIIIITYMVIINRTPNSDEKQRECQSPGRWERAGACRRGQ